VLQLLPQPAAIMPPPGLMILIDPSTFSGTSSLPRDSGWREGGAFQSPIEVVWNLAILVSWDVGFLPAYCRVIISAFGSTPMLPMVPMLFPLIGKI
jgi:hypothetical protein